MWIWNFFSFLQLPHLVYLLAMNLIQKSHLLVFWLLLAFLFSLLLSSLANRNSCKDCRALINEFYSCNNIYMMLGLVLIYMLWQQQKKYAIKIGNGDFECLLEKSFFYFSFIAKLYGIKFLYFIWLYVMILWNIFSYV